MEVKIDFNWRKVVKVLVAIFFIWYFLFDIYLKTLTYFQGTVYRAGYQQGLYEVVTTLEKNTECKPLDITVQDKKTSVIQVSCVQQKPQVQTPITGEGSLAPTQSQTLPQQPGNLVSPKVTK